MEHLIARIKLKKKLEKALIVNKTLTQKAPQAA